MNFTPALGQLFKWQDCHLLVLQTLLLLGYFITPTMQFRGCGPGLANAVELVCEMRPGINNEDKADDMDVSRSLVSLFRDSGKRKKSTPFLTKRAAKNFFMVRTRRGIVEECCLHDCHIEELEEYCPPPGLQDIVETEYKSSREVPPEEETPNEPEENNEVPIETAPSVDRIQPVAPSTETLPNNVEETEHTVPLEETDAVPVEEADVTHVPVGETNVEPDEEIDAVPLEETHVPVEETDAVSVEETDAVPIEEETHVMPVGETPMYAGRPIHVAGSRAPVRFRPLVNAKPQNTGVKGSRVTVGPSRKLGPSDKNISNNIIAKENRVANEH